MIPEPKLSNKALIELCHRLAVETESGIDIRRTWTREAESARGRIRPYFERIRDAVARGDSLAEALAPASAIFPPMFLEMAKVGEETGSLNVVMKRLERHYTRSMQARRTFLQSIAWPMIELCLAAGVIGVYILAMGVVAKMTGGKPMDMLGFGLVGVKGLFIYVNFLLIVALSITALVVGMRRGMAWARPLQRALLYIPVVGKCAEKLSLAQMAWALHLTMNVALDMRRVAQLALRATGNDYYIRHTERVKKAVGAGQPLGQALANTGAFPARFLDSLAVGEESGQIVEAMGRLANQYEDEAETSVKTIAMLLGVLVFMLVAGLLVWLIFRLYGNYFSIYEELLK